MVFKTEKLSRNNWETFEKFLGNFWEIMNNWESFEKFLRNFWEIIKKLLRKFWEMRRNWEISEKLLRNFQENHRNRPPYSLHLFPFLASALFLLNASFLPFCSFKAWCLSLCCWCCSGVIAAHLHLSYSLRLANLFSKVLQIYFNGQGYRPCFSFFRSFHLSS